MSDIEKRAIDYMNEKATSNDKSDVGWAFIAIMSGLFNIKTGEIKFSA